MENIFKIVEYVKFTQTLRPSDWSCCWMWRVICRWANKTHVVVSDKLMLIRIKLINFVPCMRNWILLNKNKKLIKNMNFAFRKFFIINFPSLIFVGRQREEDKSCNFYLFNNIFEILITLLCIAAAIFNKLRKTILMKWGKGWIVFLKKKFHVNSIPVW